MMMLEAEQVEEAQGATQQEVEHAGAASLRSSVWDGAESYLLIDGQMIASPSYPSNIRPSSLTGTQSDG